MLATTALWADHIEYYSNTEVDGVDYYLCAYVHYASDMDSVYWNGQYTYYACVTGLAWYSGTTVNIPSSISYSQQNYSITQIKENAFYGESTLTISVPTSVTVIGENAFYNVRRVIYSGTATGSPWGAKLINGYEEGYLLFESSAKTTLISCSQEASEGIAIPNTVKTISDYAFQYCNQLTSIYIPTSVLSIGEGAFAGCTGLTSLSVPSNVTTIGMDAFYDVFNVSYQGSAEGAPWGAKHLNAYMEGTIIYSDNTKTTILACSPATTGDITIPNSVKTIADSAFYECSEISSIVIGKNVESIGKYAFYDCSFSSITIPSNVISIGEYAFYGYIYDKYAYYSYSEGYLKTLTINSQAFVGKDYNNDYWFRNVFGRRIQTLIIGEGITRIGNYVCYYCDSLKNVTIPNSVTSIGYGSFRECNNLPVIDGIRYADTYLVEAIDKKKSAYTIQDGTRFLGDCSFESCSIMSTLTIPESVCYVSSSAFSGCTNVKTVNWNAKKCTFESYFYSQLTSITFGNQVEEIPNSICSGQNLITSVSLPNSVKRIGAWAFRSCTGLTSVVIPNSVQVIGEQAFGRCENLSSVSMSTNIDTIGRWAFGECAKLTAITIPMSAKFIGRNAFSECSQLKAFEVPNVNTYCDGAFVLTSCTSLEKVSGPASLFNFQPEYMGEVDYLPYNVSSIKVIGGELDETGFITINKNYKRLKTLDISATSNTTLADEAFKNSYNLETLLLPNQLEHIGYMSVAECVNLKSVDIPASVIEIDQRAFEDCRSIQTITFGGAAKSPARMLTDASSALKKIGNWAFYNAHELQNLTIPEGVEEIGDAAFYGCTYLEDLKLPSTVREIGDNCFSLCSKMKKITVTSMTPPTIYAKTFYDVNRAIPVYVLDDAVENYQKDPLWSEFDIRGGATALNQLADSPFKIQNSKFIRNGQLLILRDGKTYNAQGAEVK